MSEDNKKLENLKKYVCAAGTMEEFLHRLEAVRADELGGLDDDIPEYATENICFCCTYGNHDIRCTCEGTDCCHPEAYKDYNPAWGHGPLAADEKPEKT